MLLVIAAPIVKCPLIWSGETLQVCSTALVNRRQQLYDDTIWDRDILAKGDIMAFGRRNGAMTTLHSQDLYLIINLDLNADQSPEFVDMKSKIASLVAKLQDLPTKPPSLYIDLEGINLSRHGSISVLQIYILPIDERYLVDI
jgi:hypothetical protein